MYPLQSNETGYTFTTHKGDIYSVYFTKLDQLSSYFLKEVDTDNFYYFGIERITPKTKGKDIFIKRTVAYIIIDFFVSNPTAILVFNYSNDDLSISGRRKVFKSWFDEYSEHTLYQFYQYDFSDEVSVCALYRRQGINFDKIRSGVKNAINGLGEVMVTKP